MQDAGGSDADPIRTSSHCVTRAPRQRPAGNSPAAPANGHPGLQDLTAPRSGAGRSSRPGLDSGAPGPSPPIRAGGVPGTGGLGLGRCEERDLGERGGARRRREEGQSHLAGTPRDRTGQGRPRRRQWRRRRRQRGSTPSTRKEPRVAARPPHGTPPPPPIGRPGGGVRAASYQ